ncbi:hypothetical protein F5888DRAFT_1706466 [Russula emetica]|nr:hypothetical protein F5888DRAFT_1706466 [Russula emetica]
MCLVAGRSCPTVMPTKTSQSFMELVIRVVFHVFLASFLNFLSRLVLWVVILLVVSPLFIARHHLVLQ